ncbi:MBL fold metallo-hydrolase [Bacillus sp. JJ1521]|uniref:MBL fold metallo-hydrolase n=1 Tax=Bacillus sp. JJ1521 TaxID=3122957 RepID=UPI002FFEC708
MKIQILGTAAAEGFPGLFCNCTHCKKARELGGKNIRTRSSTIIDDTIKIDFPPDTYHHVLSHNLDLSKVEHLLFTHTHMDHFNPKDLGMRTPGFAHDFSYPLHIYGNDAAIHKCKEVLWHTENYFTFTLMHPFTTYQVGAAKVTPLPADHNPLETCFLFYIEKDGKRIFHGHDTGWFPEQTWEWLSTKKIDVAILDCTHGLLPERRNHLNIEAVKDIQKVFLEKSIMTNEGQIIATHFSHNIGLMHEDLEEIFAPSGIKVAYDGILLHV